MIILLAVLLVIALILVAVLKSRAVRAAHEEKIRQLVDHDPLTGVLSLDGFRKRAEELLRTHPDTPYLLAFANIKNFKFINESLGMSAGDDLLRFWAKQIMESLSDEEAVGRITADRFVVLRRNGGEVALRKDDKGLGPVRTYFLDHGKEIRVLISYGIYVLTPADHQQINIDRMIDYAHVTEKKYAILEMKVMSFITLSSGKKENKSLTLSIICQLQSNLVVSMFGISPR